MKCILICLLFLLVPFVANAGNDDSDFTNITFLVWTNLTDAQVGLAGISTEMGYPKCESFINGVLDTNSTTISYCEIMKCQDKDDNIVYGLKDCDSKYYSKLEKKPKKDKLKKKLE